MTKGLSRITFNSKDVFSLIETITQTQAFHKWNWFSLFYLTRRHPIEEKCQLAERTEKTFFANSLPPKHILSGNVTVYGKFWNCSPISCLQRPLRNTAVVDLELIHIIGNAGHADTTDPPPVVCRTLTVLSNPGNYMVIASHWIIRTTTCYVFLLSVDSF